MPFSLYSNLRTQEIYLNVRNLVIMYLYQNVKAETYFKPIETLPELPPTMRVLS